ncbi:MAG: hypothetical protein A2V70_13455 [Planctomycetes bacterium RBG_13_63_9]|nr:MAG: hypothetical protein A2V70_13455 [Planctomycetes bacterium RBG_13_63_9]
MRGQLDRACRGGQQPFAQGMDRPGRQEDAVAGPRLELVKTLRKRPELDAARIFAMIANFLAFGVVVFGAKVPSEDRSQPPPSPDISPQDGSETQRTQLAHVGRPIVQNGCATGV